MSYFYVKNSLGTRTSGGGVTIQTGDFATLGAAAVYATIQAAITDGATAGDFICCSSAHDYQVDGDISISGPTSGDHLNIVSVDDSNCDTEMVGGREETTVTATNDINLWERISFHKMEFSAMDLIGFSNVGTDIVFNEGKLTLKGAANYIRLGSDGVSLKLINTEVAFDSNDNYFFLDKGCTLDWRGGSLTTTDTTLDYCIRLGATDGGMFARVAGVDLSAITTLTGTDGAGTLVANVGSDAQLMDAMNIEFHNCKLDSTATLLDDALASTNHYVAMFNCSSDSAAAEYQFEINRYGGKVSDDIAVWRQDSRVFSGGKRVCAKVETNSAASIATPFYFDLPAKWGALAATNTDSVRLFLVTLTSGANLTDQNVWAEVIYMDKANKQTANYKSTRNANLLGSGTALTTDAASDWQSGTQGSGTALTTYDEHIIDIATSGNPGANQVPLIRIYVGEPSATIHFDVVIDYV